MATSQPIQLEDASRQLRTLSQRLAKRSLADLCAALNKDDSTASRIRSGESKLTIEEFSKLLQFLGLKLVDTNRVCVARETYESLAHIASKAMRDEATARKLMWDEEPE